MKRDTPFMLMESAPGLVNWHPYNKLKRPGVHNMFSLQALAWSFRCQENHIRVKRKGKDDIGSIT